MTIQCKICSNMVAKMISNLFTLLQCTHFYLAIEVNPNLVNSYSSVIGPRIQTIFSQSLHVSWKA